MQHRPLGKAQLEMLIDLLSPQLLHTTAFKYTEIHSSHHVNIFGSSYMHLIHKTKSMMNFAELPTTSSINPTSSSAHSSFHVFHTTPETLYHLGLSTPPT